MLYNRKRTVLVMAGLLAAGVAGCSSDKPVHNNPPVAAQDLNAKVYQGYPALNGTIENFAALAFDSPVLVRGYGLIAGLPRTGSGEMPPEVRAALLNRLVKNGIGFLSKGTAQYNPARILSSRQVAAVLVEGVIPPLATKGTNFDLRVVALPNTQTTDIRNGLLWTVPLRVHIRFGNRSHPMAAGRGPVFCDPILPGGKGLLPANAMVRSGTIMAGGIVRHSQPVVLDLYAPSYRIAALIQRVINERYGGFPPVAAAQNDTLITLKIPPEYRSRPAEFVDLVMHLYLRQDVPGFTHSQALVLLKALHDPMAPHRQLSVALQQLGRTILPLLRQHYHSSDPTVAFYAARAGAMMGDEDAISVLGRVALNEGSTFRLASLQALTHCHDAVRATLYMTKLLASRQVPIRLAAYKALLNMHSGAVYSQSVGGKFYLDIVPAPGRTLIYATQTGVPRIAIIGPVPSLPAGALYISQHSALTVNYPFAAAAIASRPAAALPASPAASTNLPVQLIYRDRISGDQTVLATGPALPNVLIALGQAPNPFAPKYDPRTKYIAASYQRIIEMLYTMCQAGQLPATFMLQESPQNQVALFASLNKPRPSGHLLNGSANATQRGAGVSPFTTKLPGEESSH